MDLMKRLRGIRTSQGSHSTAPLPQARISRSQLTSTSTSLGNSGRCPPVLPVPTPPVTSQLTSTQDNLCLINNNNNNNLLGAIQWKLPGSISKHLRASSRKHYSAAQVTRESRSGATVEKFVYKGHPKQWDKWRQHNVLKPFIIKTKDSVEIPVHPILLASVSPYFKSLFATQRPIPIDIINTDSKTFKLILDFVYTAQIVLTPQNVVQLLQAASLFKIRPILQRCCQFLIESLNSENCIQIYRVGCEFFCEKLRRKGKLYILYHFREVMVRPDFLKFKFEELEDLLRDDLLNVKNEEMSFNAIKTWIEHAPRERTSKIIQLLQCVRFGLMNLSFFARAVLPWKYIAESVEVQDSLFDIELFLTTMESRTGSDVDLHDPITRPRVPYEIIFAIGGWSAGSPTSFMETYDVRADRWFLSQGSDVTPRAYHGLIALEQKIYMIGGFDGNEHFNTMRCFDPTSRKWTEKANMHYPRCYVSCCVLDGHIYAMGGFNGRLRMNSVERYDPSTNQWEVLNPMTRQRSDASACSLFGKVYVAGGFNGQEVLNSVEVFDPEESQWSFIHPMQSPRSGVVITAYKDMLFAIGGFNGFTRLNTVEKYNPKIPGDWEPVADMSSPRSNFAASVIENMIFVIGGFNGTTTIPYVECYDGIQNEWFDSAHMNLNRSALAACVLRGIPNARDYSYLSRVQELLGLDHREEQSQSFIESIVEEVDNQVD